jgi:hypothetical protein
MTGLFDALGFEAGSSTPSSGSPCGDPVVLMAGEERAKEVAFGWTLGLFVLSLGLWWAFDPAGPSSSSRVRRPGWRCGG